MELTNNHRLTTLESIHTATCFDSTGLSSSCLLEYIKRSIHIAMWKQNLTSYKYIYNSSLSLMQSIVRN